MTDILILDDDEQILKLASTMAERQGYSVATVDSGEKALASIEKLEPRMLITDILMPGIDGIEVINECRKRYPELKIIAMSGGRRKISADFNLKSASMLGADATLEKPFSRDQLLQKIKLLIQDNQHD